MEKISREMYQKGLEEGDWEDREYGKEKFEHKKLRHCKHVQK